MVVALPSSIPILTSHQLILPTATLYRRQSSSHAAAAPTTTPLHYGEYAAERAELDYTFHTIPSQSRQMLQDDIIRNILNRKVKECVECDVEDQGWMGCSTNIVTESTQERAKPLALFTAGGMGAGKGHTLRYLLRKGIIRLPHNFIWVDPDSIACSLPERSQYLAANPSTASTLLHAEASLIQEILMGVARRKGAERTLVIDGSLSDCGWYGQLMAKFSAAGFELEILFVFAGEGTMLERAKKRAEDTGRVTDPESIRRSRIKSPQCVTSLARKEHVSRVRLFDNSSSTGPPILAHDSDLDANWQQGGSVDVVAYVEGRNKAVVSRDERSPSIGKL